MVDGSREREQVENVLLVCQRVEVYSFIRDTGITQRRKNGGQMIARAHKNGDGRTWLFERNASEFNHLRSLGAPLIIINETVKLRRRPSFCAGRRRWTKRHFSSLGIIVRRRDTLERIVHPLDNGGL